MPLLCAAEAATLLHIEDGPEDGPTVEDAAEYLTAHGCQAQTVTEPRRRRAGEALLFAALGQAADPLVMGATHNPIRELVFGGAAFEVLWNATIPVLMAH